MKEINFDGLEHILKDDNFHKKDVDDFGFYLDTISKYSQKGVIIGSFAVVLYSMLEGKGYESKRNVSDIDIIFNENENVDYISDIINDFREKGFSAYYDPLDMVFPINFRDHNLVPVHVLCVDENDETADIYKDSIDNPNKIVLRYKGKDYEMNVMSKDNLIKIKSKLGREKDLRDISILNG